MGSTNIEKRYQHFNDCTEAGCPGHAMQAGYNRTSDTFRYRTTAESEWVWMDKNELETLLDLVEAIRTEVAGIPTPTIDGVTFLP